jgi:hypothetical protein
MSAATIAAVLGRLHEGFGWRCQPLARGRQTRVASDGPELRLLGRCWAGWRRCPKPVPIESASHFAEPLPPGALVGP